MPPTSPTPPYSVRAVKELAYPSRSGLEKVGLPPLERHVEPDRMRLSSSTCVRNADKLFNEGRHIQGCDTESSRVVVLEELKRRIRDELVVGKTRVLEENLSVAKRLFALSEEGDIDLRVDRSRLTNRQLIALYMVAKAYAKEGGLVESEVVTNDELVEKLGLSYNTVRGSATNRLRREGIMLTDDGQHRIEYSKIGVVLGEVLER